MPFKKYDDNHRLGFTDAVVTVQRLFLVAYETLPSHERFKLVDFKVALKELLLAGPEDAELVLLNLKDKYESRKPR